MEGLSKSSAERQLEALCQEHGIRRFAAAEMVEMLADGESVEWLVEQALPGAGAEASAALTAALVAVAAECAPRVADDESTPDNTPALAEAGPADNDAAGAAAGTAAASLDWSQFKDVPLPPGVDRAQLKKLLASPQGELLADFSAFCEERGVDADAGGEGTEGKLQELHEEWLQTPRPSLDGRKPADALEGGRLFPRKVETFRREAPKVGRNDPCPCGSGRKHKKCCGKGE
jgi:hypothetical protein